MRDVLAKGERRIARSQRFLMYVVLVAMLTGVVFPRRGWTQESPTKAWGEVPAGFRVLRGRFLTLVTDLPAADAIDRLPESFDAAVPQWCDYFGVDRSRVADWRVRGYLMQNEQRFRHANLRPANLPPFLHGYQRGDEIWWREQPSAYYRRHLMLHEGTHAFMHQILKTGMRPGWYSEGVAELLATHAGEGASLKLNVLPADKEAVPEWGRIRIIREAVAGGQRRSIPQVLQLQTRDFQTVDAYAWSWALARFWDAHPSWQAAFRRLATRPPMPLDDYQAEVTQRLLRGTEPWQMEAAWQVFLTNLDYGYDVSEDQIEFKPAAVGPGGSVRIVKADRGWQFSHWQVESGRPYRLVARGRFFLNQDRPPWPCEAGGVTLRYHQGRPLGMLLGAVPAIPSEASDDRSRVSDDHGSMSFSEPMPVGLQHDFIAPRSGPLFLRVNEMAGELSDNQGGLEVQLVPLPPEASLPTDGSESRLRRRGGGL